MKNKIILLALALFALNGFAQEDTVKIRTKYFKDGKLHLVNSSHQDIIVSVLKKCEDDNSVVVRYYAVSGKEQKTTFSFFEELNKV